MAQYELITYKLFGAPVTSEDGLTMSQPINAVSNQVGNTYESRYVTDAVVPAPSFPSTLSIPEAKAYLQQCAIDFIAQKYPNT